MKTVISLALVAAVVTSGAILVPRIALAYRGDVTVKGPNYTPERHEIMTKAFETNDYESWKSQMAGRGRVTQVVNAGNFARFAEAHRLSLAGDQAGANAIRAELGLGAHGGQGMQNGYKK